MKTLNVAYKNLVRSSKNVRKVLPKKEADKQLIASIEHIGLLYPLIVIPAANQGAYEVIAGGRRLAAIGYLIGIGTEGFTEDMLIRVEIAKTKDATEISLAENLRAAMHPADEYVAYKVMADEGKSERDIATAFGVPIAQVKRLLKLGGVAPALIEIYRADKIDLDSLAAFTVTDDHEKQIACYKELTRSSYIRPHLIKKFLLDGGVRADDAMAKFVGLKAYKKAGGGIISDLFESETFLSDVELLQELAIKMLQTEADSLAVEGWKWIDVSLVGTTIDRSLRFLEVDYSNVPLDLVNRIAAVQNKIDEMESNEWDEEDEDAYDQLQNELHSLELEKEVFGTFTDAQKLGAGCRVTFSHAGELAILKGLVRREDEALQPKINDGKGEMENGSNHSLEGIASTIESSALQADLKTYYEQAFQAELSKHESLCFDLLVFTIAQNILSKFSYRRMLGLTTSPNQHKAVDIEQTTAFAQLEELKSTLNLAWVEISEESGRFNSFTQLKRPEKMKIMCVCVSVLAQATPKADTDLSLSPFIAATMKFNVQKYWKPTEANYFSRIRKADLLNIGRESLGEQWLKANEKRKHGEIAQAIADAPEIANWMPTLLS